MTTVALTQITTQCRVLFFEGQQEKEQAKEDISLVFVEKRQRTNSYRSAGSNSTVFPGSHHFMCRKATCLNAPTNLGISPCSSLTLMQQGQLCMSTNPKARTVISFCFLSCQSTSRQTRVISQVWKDLATTLCCSEMADIKKETKMIF